MENLKDKMLKQTEELKENILENIVSHVEEKGNDNYQAVIIITALLDAMCCSLLAVNAGKFEDIDNLRKEIIDKIKIIFTGLH